MVEPPDTASGDAGEDQPSQEQIAPTVEMPSAPSGATVAETEAGATKVRPGAPPAALSAPPTGVPEGTLTSPLEALRHDEIRRSRILGLTGVSFSAVVASMIPLLDATAAMTALLGAALTVVIAANLWLVYLCGDPGRYVFWKVATIWMASTLGVGLGICFFGVFSPAPMALLLGIYFVSLGNDFRIALGVYLVSAASQLVAGLLFALEIVADPGLVKLDDLPVRERLVAVFLVQAVYFCVFLLARRSHRTTLRSMTEFDRAVRAIAQREALLHEARQDLERALQVGGAGRFTGQSLGSFRLGNVLGRGAMGEVYEAVRETGDDRPAAIKLLQPALLSNPTYVQRFLREVEVASSLETEHVVEVLEVSDPRAPFPYLAMERLVGRDLAQILRSERRLSPRKVVDLVQQIGRGIHAAGEAGIVHRDLKPQNLFLCEPPGQHPVWKILDFGVSKLAETGGTLTQGNVIGTPIYMAPEQASCTSVDHRTDLYALAAIAYRCLTGHLPFRGKDVPAILYQVVHQMPARPSALAALERDVDLALAIALAKEPGRRFPSAAELTAALAAALRGELDGELRERGRRLEQGHPWQGD